MSKIDIQIKAKASFEAVKLFRKIYESFLTGENITKAEVYYVKSQGQTSLDDDPKTWPLQIFTEDGSRISVYNVSAGYGGSGPHATKEILEIAGFEGAERVLDDTIGDEIELHFTK